MFARRLLNRLATVALLVGILGAPPVQAQSILGFTIDPTQGFPGDTVSGQVNPADVDANCVTELEPFQAQFQAVLDGPYAGGAAEGELFSRFFPGGEFVFENHDQTAYSLTGITLIGISANIGGAAETALPQTFVMTFVDLATQQPLGPLGHFDPATGVGSVVVPNLTPGAYPIAAACVAPPLDIDTLEAGIRRNGAYLESIGAPADLNSPEFEEFVKEFLGTDEADLFAFLAAIGPTLIQNIVTPSAVGIQFFTILQPLRHLQCYNLKNGRLDPIPVTLSDRFGTRSMTVRKARNLCAPANKNGEDPSAPTSPDFLTAYSIKGGGKFERVSAQTVVDQFGTLTVNIVRPRILLVPTAYSPTSPPSSAVGAFVDHFTCYDVRITKGTPPFAGATVTVQTALETATIQVQRPKRLCVPTNKNGEDPTAPTFPENFLCYKTKAKGSPSGSAFLSNQFGPQVYGIGARGELCVPTLLNPPPPTTTTSTTATTSTSTSTTTTSTESTTTSTESTTTSTESTTTSTESTTTSTESTTTSTESTTTSTESTTTSTESTTTSTEPTTTTATSSTTTTTAASPSGAFLDDAG